MTPLADEVSPDTPIVIPDHTLYGYYPPKIAEAEVKPVAETGEIVLSRVVVPQTVVVHDGVPTDSTAPNYYVPYRDYIKNVASSEIYATWPRSSITANVLAIMSFTLNRVYTEWYRNQGYDCLLYTSKIHTYPPDQPLTKTDEKEILFRACVRCNSIVYKGIKTRRPARCVPSQVPLIYL